MSFGEDLILIVDEPDVLSVLAPLQDRVRIQFARYCVGLLVPGLDAAWGLSNVEDEISYCQKVLVEFGLTGRLPDARVLAQRLATLFEMASGAYDDSRISPLEVSALLALIESAHYSLAVLQGWTVRGFLLATRPILDLHVAVCEEFLYAMEDSVIFTSEWEAADRLEQVPAFVEMLAARERCVLGLAGASSEQAAVRHVDELLAGPPLALWGLLANLR